MSADGTPTFTKDIAPIFYKSCIECHRPTIFATMSLTSYEDARPWLRAIKTGLMFTLNRVTGKPIFDIEERPVPKSDVPGEQASPTQPFPVKPEPLTQNTISRRRQDLDRDLTLQPGVGRPIHLAHSTVAKLGKDLIGPKNSTNHSQVLALASVDPPQLVL